MIPFRIGLVPPQPGACHLGPVCWIPALIRLDVTLVVNQMKQAYGRLKFDLRPDICDESLVAVLEPPSSNGTCS